MQMQLIQILAGCDTTWRPCAIYYIGITANPSKKKRAASAYSVGGCRPLRSAMVLVYRAVGIFILRGNPCQGGRRRRLRNAETRNLILTKYFCDEISKQRLSALVAVMGETTNTNRVTAGKPECTNPLAILTCKEQSLLTRGLQATYYPRHRVVSRANTFCMRDVFHTIPCQSRKRTPKQFFFGGGGHETFFYCKQQMHN